MPLFNRNLNDATDACLMCSERLFYARIVEGKKELYIVQLHICTHSLNVV